MGRVLITLAFAAGSALAQEALTFETEPFLCAAFEFKLIRPQGWTMSEAETAVSFQGPTMGFRVTREPMLHDPESFAQAWQGTLDQAGKGGKVKEGKAGRCSAWQATWKVEAEPARLLEIWRVYWPDAEILYNLAFSVPAAADPRPLVDAVIRSFVPTAPKPKLEFEPGAMQLGPRVQMRLPKGFIDASQGGVRLGGGTDLGYVKLLAGYNPPRVTAALGVRGVSPYGSYEMPDGKQVPGTAIDELALLGWGKASEGFGKVTEKPRKRGTRYGELKGFEATAAGVDKEGIPREFYAFSCKLTPEAAIVVTFVVDARETRLYKELFRQICSSISYKD